MHGNFLNPKSYFSQGHYSIIELILLVAQEFPYRDKHTNNELMN